MRTNMIEMQMSWDEYKPIHLFEEKMPFSTPGNSC